MNECKHEHIYTRMGFDTYCIQCKKNTFKARAHVLYDERNYHFFEEFINIKNQLFGENVCIRKKDIYNKPTNPWNL